MEEFINIANPWDTPTRNRPFFRVSKKPVYVNGEFRVYRVGISYKDYLHCKGTQALTELAGINRGLIDALAKDELPDSKTDLHNHYHFLRCKEMMEKVA
jgi:hypothetical protein